MRVVTLGIPDCTIEDFQRALGLTDDQVFVLEQSYLKKEAELSTLHEQKAAWNAWRARSEKRYHRLYMLVHRLLRAVCSHYGLTKKYALQDLALLNPDDPLLSAAGDAVTSLDMHTLPR